MNIPAPNNEAKDLRSSAGFADLLLDSYRRLLGQPMTEFQDGAPPTAHWLYRHAPFCLLAHCPGPDPLFIYANLAAQACFGYSWDEFLTLPSRLSAEAPNQETRQRMLEAVARDGCLRDYRGMRIAKSGRRFWIEGAVVWQLRDRLGFDHGQAAVFHAWQDVPNASQAKQ